MDLTASSSSRLSLGLAAGAAYVGSVVLANVVTTEYGMVPVGFGLAATAGTYAAGAALGLRDLVQDTLGLRGVLVLMAVASALSYLLADPFIATASLVAFAVAALVDLAVYTPLRRRGWALAVLASNVAGAVLDTYLFLLVAGFPVTRESVAGQLVGKLLWATLLPVALIALVRRVRAA